MNVTAITAPTAYAPPGLSRPASHAQAPSARNGLKLPQLEIPTRESLAHDMASFAADVGNMFHEAGIHVPPNPILTNDFQGYVRVANDHPDKDKIEQLFKDNPQLQQRYAKISAQSSLLRAAEHYSRFADEYERLKSNPAAQQALAEAEIARNKAPFFLTITAHGAEPFFGMSGITA